jgi:hypothetical protein
LLPISGEKLLELGVPPELRSKALEAVTNAWFKNQKLDEKQAIGIVKGIVNQNRPKEK